jgi:hypothetical protein
MLLVTVVDGRVKAVDRLPDIAGIAAIAAPGCRADEFLSRNETAPAPPSPERT